MRPITLFTLFSLFSTLLPIHFLYSEANDQLKHDIADAFKIFKNFPTAIAVFDEDQDGDLDCMKVVRTEFDEDGQTATYVLVLKNQNGHDNKNITHHFEAGASPDTPVLTVDGVADPEQIVDFIYTDYETCVISHLPHNGRQECILWTSDDAKRDLGQQCIDQYRANCDVENMAYDESCDAL